MNEKARVVFDISLLVFFGLLAVIALEYNAKARAMPFIFGSGGFILVLMQTGYDLSPRVRNKLRFLEEKGASWAQGPAGTEESMEDEAGEQEGEEGSRGALGGGGASRLGQDSAYFRMAGRVLDSPELLGVLDSCSVPRLRDAGSRRAEKARIRGGGKCCYAAVHVCIV